MSTNPADLEDEVENVEAAASKEWSAKAMEKASSQVCFFFNSN